MSKNKLLALQKKAIVLKAQNSLAYGHFFVDLSLSAFAIFLSLQNSIPLWLLGQLLLFVCAWRWFSILHSCAHGAFFSNSTLNTFAGHFASVFSLVSYSTWKESHLLHHRWTGWKIKDPSLLSTPPQLSDKTAAFLDFCWRNYIPVFSFIFLFMKIEKTVKEQNQKPHIIWQQFPYLVHAIAIPIWGITYFQIVALPLALYLVTSDIVVLSQHALLPMKTAGEIKPIPANLQDPYTRTLGYPLWISRFVLLYFDKHNLHHKVPYVPHYHLGQLQDENENEVPWQVWISDVKKIPGHQVYFE